MSSEVEKRVEDSLGSADNGQPKFTFENALRRLQEIVTELEQTDFNLDEALDSYEEGVSIARECLQRLENAEIRIRELRLRDGEGP